MIFVSFCFVFPESLLRSPLLHGALDKLALNMHEPRARLLTYLTFNPQNPPCVFSIEIFFLSAGNCKGKWESCPSHVFHPLPSTYPRIQKQGLKTPCRKATEVLSLNTEAEEVCSGFWALIHQGTAVNGKWWVTKCICQGYSTITVRFPMWTLNPEIPHSSNNVMPFLALCLCIVQNLESNFELKHLNFWSQTRKLSHTYCSCQIFSVRTEFQECVAWPFAFCFKWDSHKYQQFTVKPG